jgi:hypothetical protein
VKIYTGYWANVLKYPNPVAVSRGILPGFTGPVAEYLMPPADLLRWYSQHKGEMTAKKHYTDEYTKQVLNEAPEIIYGRLEELGLDPITLICYERPGEFCHRRLIGEYLKSGGFDYMGEYRV